MSMQAVLSDFALQAIHKTRPNPITAPTHRKANVSTPTNTPLVALGERVIATLSNAPLGCALARPASFASSGLSSAKRPRVPQIRLLAEPKPESQ
ncbi:hypothetical protein PtA15_7A161 [Puccinia triticina]|uniref:Uncharacterized protein n=1 Tax=Puccinia triticina TaxID=208348 RepID=A0ABY7CRN3_9BASI|nr:uncharacterized protein PtA15_7A161 [Puccinia triticina]WAQ86435.1 hypothetical protein PtA15_7A161 [Puccinia triticina]